MLSPERKDIYHGYEELVKKIIDEKRYQVYAESEINELNKQLVQTFESIKNRLLKDKAWESH